MGFKGYLLKVGNFEITGEKFIKASSYEVTKEVQDMDSYRDANGLLHRNALSHIPNKVVFESMPNLTNVDLRDFLGKIQANFTVPLERKAIIEAYIPETDDYVTQEMYMAGPTLKIKMIDPKNNVVKYEPIKMTFIGY